MRTPTETIEIGPGTFVVHPRGELHEYANGPQRTLLFRVRYGDEMSGRAHLDGDGPVAKLLPAIETRDADAAPGSLV
jgi:hypothetical protein